MTQVAGHQGKTRDLLAGFAGELIGPDHPGYGRARTLFNGMFDRRPALIARCTGPADVQAALAYARSRGLVVAVRGGGHSFPGYSSCDGGIVIDTSPMKRADIDVAGRTGRFGAGLTWGELDAATQAHGLAVTGGRVSHTGVAGFTLASGSGWLERKYGTAAESLLAAQIVTADGRVLRASTSKHAELLWGLKGGGGNFGVVTELEFRLHPVGPVIFGGMIMHPRAAAKQLGRLYRDFIEQAPDELSGGFALFTAPSKEFVPRQVRGKPACGLTIFSAGDPAEGEKAFRPLLHWGQPWVRRAGPMPYTEMQRLIDPEHPWGISVYAKNDYLHQLPGQAIDTMIDAFRAPRSPFTHLYLCPLGGALARSDRSAMAQSLPGAPWTYYLLAQWWDPAVASPEIAWARRFMDTMRQWSVDKAPANFIAADEGTGRLRSSYGNQTFDRLVALKNNYDPGNVFALNPNIPPSPTPTR
ncbi:MAG: FAD-binding oxidoreductase [Streptosporangiaceae bacterium]|nr:FAD-binding oxidoreductase [Streptosporangiaceae bacterium]